MKPDKRPSARAQPPSQAGSCAYDQFNLTDEESRTMKVPMVASSSGNPRALVDSESLLILLPRLTRLAANGRWLIWREPQAYGRIAPELRPDGLEKAGKRSIGQRCAPAQALVAFATATPLLGQSPHCTGLGALPTQR